MPTYSYGVKLSDARAAEIIRKAFPKWWHADKADGYESVSELTKFLEETKELRRSEDWRQAQREYVELICQLGDILLEEQEDTGE